MKNLLNKGLLVKVVLGTAFMMVDSIGYAIYY